MMLTWQVMITSIPHRHEKLLRLLEDLDRQAVPGFGAILYRDDLEEKYGQKTQAMSEAATADYISSVDDDDLLAPDGVSRVMEALEFLPDYVGFTVRWTRDGAYQKPVIHSLACRGWRDKADVLERDITQFNPIRRELALLGTWEGGYEAERRWSDQVRETGKVVREKLVLGDPVYYYQETTTDTFSTSRKPLGHMPAIPSYKWLTQIGPYA